MARRQDKYPDTECFHFYNANPKNKITGDCVTRALCTALGLPYNQTVMEQAEVQCKTGYDNATSQGMDYYLKDKKWVKRPQPRKSDNTKYTGAEFCAFLKRTHGPKRIIANIGGHHTIAIINYVIQDIWNSSYKTIGNYWINPNEE